MERKDVLKLQKLCLEYDNFLAFPLAAELLGVKYDNLYKFFRDGRNEGMFVREKAGAMYYIKFAPSLPQTGPPLDKGKAKLKLPRKPRTGKTKQKILGKFESLELWCKEAKDLLVTEEYEEYVRLWEKLAAGVRCDDFVSIDQSVTRQLRSLFSFNSDIAGSFEEMEHDITSLRPVRTMPRHISDD